MRTAIVTDTNSGVSLEEGKELGVYVLPMPVIIEEKDYLEQVSITNQQLYEAILAGREVSSSQPSPGSLTELWNRVLRNGYDELVYIPMSSGLSSSCQTAMALAADYKGQVQVVDNHRISVTLHESVLDALSMANEGFTALEIKSYLEQHAYDSSIYVAVNSLDLLRKSGRVTTAAAAIATVMHLKPILTIQGGKLDSFAKGRGVKQTEKRMLEAVASDIKERFSASAPEKVTIGAAGTFDDPEAEKAWTDSVREFFPNHPVFFRPLSCSIACHVSVNAIGIGVSVRR